MDEIINKYKLLAPLQNENAGSSRWTYASRKGVEYFLKEFMNPIYPDEGVLSESLRKGKIIECQEYEQQKTKLYKVINSASDGNLVRIFEFFRCKSHYYIAMPKISSETIAFEDILKSPLMDRVLLCRTAARSIMLLHKAHVVHSDIKDSNILLSKTVTGKIVAKIIDFDCSFFESNPPTTEDDLGGDQVYLAPEACQFLCGDEIKLTCQIDVFALGLLFHQYLTGKLPFFDHEEYDYAHEAVLDDKYLEVSPEIPGVLKNMIEQMLLADPEKRISMEEAFAVLGEYILGKESVVSEECATLEADNDEEKTQERELDTNKDDAKIKSPKDFFYSAKDF